MTSSRWSCPLCGLSPVGDRSKEHVLTHWQREMFGPGQLAINGQPIKQKHLVVHVCGDCNAWMNTTFENSTRDLIKSLYAGVPTTINEQSAERLAAYMTKHILLMNVWGDGKPDPGKTWNPYFVTEDYRRFRRTGQPFDDTEVYVGCVRDASPLQESTVIAAIPETAGLPATIFKRYLLARGSSMQMTSFGHFVALWVRVPGGPSATWSPGQAFIERTRKAGLLHQVWPTPEGQHSWPTRLSFDTTTYERWTRWMGYLDRPTPSLG